MLIALSAGGSARHAKAANRDAVAVVRRRFVKPTIQRVTGQKLAGRPVWAAGPAFVSPRITVEARPLIGELPFTGLDVAALGLIGICLMFGGAALFAARSRWA